MRLLLTGASGLLGRSLRIRLSAVPEFQLTAAAYSRAEPPLIRADLRNPWELRRLFDAAQPDFVIHAAAERRPDVVDKDPALAESLNVAATAAMAEECAKRGAFLLYISTDYVYDGFDPPYFPDSPVHPLNTYGAEKLAGERAIASFLDDAAVLRIPVLYGPVLSLEESSVTVLALALKSGRPQKIEAWANRYPIHVDDVSEAIVAILRERMKGKEALEAARVQGGLPLYLLSGPRAWTKYAMTMAMAAGLGIDASFLAPDPAPPRGAPRPRDCGMDTSRLEALGWSPGIAFEPGILGAIEAFFPT
ncbi:MAG: SDR family oxidoreductase [Spirochaetes bacterium]|nr:SDR family oxidoreductase [Spirochaetota bacterium]